MVTEMKVLIIGAGETGFYIASELSEDDFKVTVVDINPDQLKTIKSDLNVAGILGNGTSLSVLEKAGIQSTDLVIASTDHDETNLICCLLADHYSVKHKIAVTKTESFIKKKVIQRYIRSGISQIINSTMVAVQEINDTASLASAVEVSAFGEKDILLVGCRIKKGSPWENKYLKDIRQPQIESRFLIASIVRNGKSSIPSGQDQILQGDYVYILIPRQIANALNDILKVRISSNRKAVIVGGGLIAEKVAVGLAKSHYEVTLICQHEIHAAKLKKRFAHRKSVTVKQGQIESVKEQLKAEVAISSLFIAVSGDDHLNIFTGMIARYLGASKVIALINRQDMLQCAEAVDIDVTVSPRLSTARQIKKMVRGTEQSLNYTTISETNMEVMEMIAGNGSKIMETPLKSLKLPPDTLVGAIIKESKKAIIPTGETVIEAGDKVIMVSMPENVPKLRTIIEGVSKNASTGLTP
jgi:trk/ktr system potassium uptake protein